MKRFRIAVIASHAGTTMQAIIDAVRSGALQAEVCLVISNNSASGAAQRAKRHGIPFRHLSHRTHPNPVDLDQVMCRTLVEFEINLVMLAGYMKKLGPQTLAHFQGRVLNTHPALLPKFGGQGMYGDRVHEAVLEAGESTTGVSIHVVTAQYDDGPVIAQTQVPVEAGDDAEALAERVKSREKLFLIETLHAIVDGRLAYPVEMQNCGDS